MKQSVELFMQVHKPEGHLQQYCEEMLKRYENQSPAPVGSGLVTLHSSLLFRAFPFDLDRRGFDFPAFSQITRN